MSTRPRSAIHTLRPALRCAVILAAALTPLGCDGEEGWPMVDQPRYEALEPSVLFEDGASARPPVPGTVSREAWTQNPGYNTGETADGLVQRIPAEITRQMLDRGEQRFNIYCKPCHGYDGSGRGMIVERGYTAPPSLHIPRLRTAPAGHFFTVITNGLGRMPSYAGLVPTEDRWAIIAYIRALQLSQHMRVEQLPTGGETEETPTQP